MVSPSYCGMWGRGVAPYLHLSQKSVNVKLSLLVQTFLAKLTSHVARPCGAAHWSYLMSSRGAFSGNARGSLRKRKLEKHPLLSSTGAPITHLRCSAVLAVICFAPFA